MSMRLYPTKKGAGIVAIITCIDKETAYSELRNTLCDYFVEEGIYRDGRCVRDLLMHPQPNSKGEGESYRIESVQDMPKFYYKVVSGANKDCLETILAKKAKTITVGFIDIGRAINKSFYPKVSPFVDYAIYRNPIMKWLITAYFKDRNRKDDGEMRDEFIRYHNRKGK